RRARAARPERHDQPLSSASALLVACCSPVSSLTRTGWDSNPRYPCGHTGFRDRPFQPLTHLSLRCDAREAETLSGSEDESRGEDRLFPQPSNPLKRLGASASLLRSG